jgi:ribonuclease J
MGKGASVELFLDHKNAVTARDITENQGEYIFRCDFFELKELIDIKPETGQLHSERL